MVAHTTADAPSEYEGEFVFVSEWIRRGTKEDGTPLEERGVTIIGIRDGQIAWGRLYPEEPNGKV
jgi:ketosteroid isomerase-like protein